jgi:membrane fusion protein (multidrug efflux system)
MPRPSGRFSLAPGPILTGVLLLLSLAQPAAAQTGGGGPPAVGVEEARRQPITERTEFIGRVEAIDRVDLRARITGFLDARLFKEGEEVQQGAVLFRIERPPFEAAVDRRRATLAAMEAEVTNARTTLGRARELLRTPAGTQSRVDDAVAAERSATANMMGAQADLRTAQISLGYTDITAPIAGKIGRTTFTVGNVVTPDSGALATIVSQDPMRIAFPISQRQALELRSRYESRGGASAVQIRVRTADGRPYAPIGHVDFIDNQIDRSTDTILIRATIPNPLRQVNGAATADRELIDGQFVSVSVEGVTPVQALTLPRAAVLSDQQGNYVFIVDAQNKAQRRNVRLGTSSPERAVIEEGLQEGEKVVVEGIQRVRPGQEVAPAPASAPPAGAAPAPGRAG